MNWAALLVGAAAGMAVAFARTYVEATASRQSGLPPSALFEHRDVLVPFLALATAANIYAMWLIVSYGGVAARKLSAFIAMALLLASQMIQLHIALRPTRRDLDLAVISCAAYVYLFALYIAALFLRTTLWMF